MSRFSVDSKVLRGLSLLMLAFVGMTSVKAEDRIEASKAPFHVGKTVLACGSVAQVTQQPKVIYLNLDRRFPDQTLGLVVWQSDRAAFESRLGSLASLQGKRVCARGRIEDFRNKLQLVVKNPQFLRLMTN